MISICRIADRLLVVAVAVVWIIGMIASASDSWGQSLARQSNDEGQVMVQVTPQDISAQAPVWRFTIALDTHVKPLTDDLLSAASLSDGKGREEKASGWEGDPPGGHHRKGVLAFKPIDPLPGAVVLKLRGVGGVAERSFVWNVASP